LLLVPAARQIADADRGPTQFGHQLSHPPIRARCTAALRHLKQVQKCLAADAFLAVELDLAADTGLMT
jgi:hypothetical protein